MTDAPLVLASASPARARLLREAGVGFDVRPARVDEAALKASLQAATMSPSAIAGELAVAKALEVAGRCDAWVIGADQTLDLDGTLFDKPETMAEARAQLQALRGRPHRLHAALAVARGEAAPWRWVETATLHVRAFSDDFLEGYLAEEGERLLGCVGAYRLEGPGVQLFDRVDGDYFTILGLPLPPLLGFLRSRGCIAS